MKKRIVSLLFALITTLGFTLQAQTLTSTAPNGVFTAEDIEYWIGNGSNEIAIVLSYNSDEPYDNFVIGYRWNGNNITLEDALTGIAYTDSRFDMDVSGSMLNDFGFDYDEDGIFEYSAYMNGYDYLCLKEDCTDTPVGMSSFIISGNRWISIELKAIDLSDWDDCFAQSGTYTAITAPNDEPLPCLLPSNLHIDFITENSAIIYLGTLPANYTLYLKAEGESSYTSYSIASEVTYTMENLASGTNYECYIVKDCGEGSLSAESQHLTFTTLASQGDECTISSFPYTEDFESYGITGGGVYPYPTCWTKITTGNIPNVNTTKHSGNGGLYLQAAPNTQVVAVMPEIADNIALNTLSLKFWGKRGSAGNRITVGVMSDKDDATTFDTLFAVSPSSNAWAEYTVDLSSYTGSARYIAFMCNASRYYIDDVELSQSAVEPVCETPAQFRSQETWIEDTQATLFWESETATQFIVYYRVQGSVEYASHEVNGNLFTTLENLQEGTTYECYIVAKCSETNLSEASAVITFTTKTSTPDAPQMTDENIVAWAKGMEVKRSSTVTTGNYYDAIGQATTTEYVAILGGTATATFDRPVVNGDGADFVVFANNNNEDDGQAFVEVSSNGVNFFRFADKTPVLATGFGVAYDLSDLSDNDNLDKNNIRLVRLVDDNIGGYCLAGIGIYNGGEQYLIADFEDATFLSAANTYEIVSTTNYTRTEEDEDMELTYYYKDHVSAGLNFEGIGYDMMGWFMAMGFGASNGTSTTASGNGVSPDYYVSSALAGVEGPGYTYMQGYDAGAWAGVTHNVVSSSNNNSSFIPQGVYVSHSMASYTYTGSTNDNQPGYHKVVATGYRTDGTTAGSVSVYITQNGTAYKDWKWLDLSSFGEVAKIVFCLESNYANSYGMLIPSYFCVDNFVYTAGEEIPCTPTSSTTTETICAGESYEFNGNTYSETGTYTTTLTNAAGCDSTATLNLTVLPLNTAEETITVCYGESAVFNGQAIAEGTNTITVAGQEGDCDTVYTVTLVVLAENTPINEQVTLGNAELPYTYHGEEYSEYGTYTITEEDENGCPQEYVLTLVHNSGIAEVENEYSASVYPNPASDNATLIVKGLNEEAAIVVTDQAGRVISTAKLAAGQESLEISSSALASGVYYIRIQTANSVRTEKLIKR